MTYVQSWDFYYTNYNEEGRCEWLQRHQIQDVVKDYLQSHADLIPGLYAMYDPEYEVTYANIIAYRIFDFMGQSKYKTVLSRSYIGIGRAVMDVVFDLWRDMNPKS